MSHMNCTHSLADTGMGQVRPAAGMQVAPVHERHFSVRLTPDSITGIGIHLPIHLETRFIKEWGHSSLEFFIFFSTIPIWQHVQW